VRKYEVVSARRSHFSVKKMCGLLSISESGYYRWLRQPESERAIEGKALKQRIKELYAEQPP